MSWGWESVNTLFLIIEMHCIQEKTSIPLLVSLILAGGFNIGSVLANVPVIVLRAYAQVVGGFDPDATDTRNRTILSFLTSSIVIGSLVSIFITAPIVNKIGRKSACILFSVLVSIFLALTLIPVSYLYLIIIRFFAGIPSTSFLIVFPAWISELSPDAIRGRLTSCLQLGNSTGTFLVYLLVIVVKHWPFMWQIPTGFTIFSCLVTFILAIPIRESPSDNSPNHEQSHHRQQQPSSTEMNQTAVSATSLCTDTSVPSHSATLDTGEKSTDPTGLSSTPTDSPVSLKEIFCNRIYRRSILISVCMPLMQQGIGVNAILTYAGSIFRQLDFPDSDVIGASLLALWCVLSGILAVPLVERKGRRYLIFIGMPIILFSLILLAFSYLITNQTLTTVFLLISIALYFFAFSFSIGPLIFTVCGESFPQRIRMRLMSFTFLIFRIITIIVMTSFPYMLDILYVTFFVYFCIGLVSTILCWFALPELKQKSPEEIEKAMLTEHVFELFTLTGKTVRKRSSVQPVENHVN